MECLRKFETPRILTLTLFVIGVFGANHHDFAVALDNLAFVAHRLYGCSDFHTLFLLVKGSPVRAICFGR
jgi:hypothetical protein